MKKTVSALAIVVLFTTCKKDKLEGETTLLEGKWTWRMTEVWHSNACMPGGFDTIPPRSDFWIWFEFLQKGRMNMEEQRESYKGSDEKRRFTIEKFEYNSSFNGYDFHLRIYGGSYMDIFGKILDRDRDTLIMTGIPYKPSPNEQCDPVYTNIYTK